jgi:hypothetical protein
MAAWRSRCHHVTPGCCAGANLHTQQTVCLHIPCMFSDLWWSQEPPPWLWPWPPWSWKKNRPIMFTKKPRTATCRPTIPDQTIQHRMRPRPQTRPQTGSADKKGHVWGAGRVAGGAGGWGAWGWAYNSSSP